MKTQRRQERTRTAGVYKRRTRRGDVYYARYRTKDRQQVGQTFTTLEEAEAFLIEQKHRVHRGTHIDKAKQKTSWSTVAEAWMKAKEMKGRKARTLKGYQHILDSWCAPWDDYAIGSIEFGDVQALIESVTEKGRSPHTVRNVFNVVRGVLGYAVRAGYLHQNVALLVTEDLPALTHHEPHFLTAHEVELLARQFNDKGALIVRLAAWSGLRAGEIAGLRVKHINQVRSKITVAETVIVLKNELRADTPKSTKSNRVVPVGKNLTKMLADWIKDNGLTDPEDYLFAGDDDFFDYGRWYAKQFVPAAAAAGLAPLRFHDLRHTYASLMHAKWRSMLEVSRWMGHSTYRLTADTYSHVWDVEDDTLGDALDFEFGGTLPANVVPISKATG